MTKNLKPSDMLAKAFTYAVKKHQNEKRKGNDMPYIFHPVDVMNNVTAVKKNSTNIPLLAAASLLHDVVENCGVKMSKIAKKFGYQVASIVDELTIDDEMLGELGKTEYLCRTMMRMSSYALTIKLSDRLSNVRDMEGLTKTWIQNYVDQTYTILDRLAGRKLTKTHRRLIKLIKRELLKYGEDI